MARSLLLKQKNNRWPQLSHKAVLELLPRLNLEIFSSYFLLSLQQHGVIQMGTGTPQHSLPCGGNCQVGSTHTSTQSILEYSYQFVTHIYSAQRSKK
jgi:hypothetical protein